VTRYSGSLSRDLHDGTKSAGISLLELMVAILVLASLIMIAIPSYERYRQKTLTFKAEVAIAATSATIKNYWQDARAYPDSLADVHMDGLADPWGHPYIYYNIDKNGKGHARKDHALNPLNTDFDLYSAGPDGLTKPQISQSDSLDDIIRARDGAFIGVAADF